MQYNQPLDQPTLPNAPYIDGNANAGIQGSIVPAASIEYDQRETVEVIFRANSRGYSDFSGASCAPPANTDLMQLRKAIEGFIRSQIVPPASDLIDSQVTFHVHGATADFPDLNAAFEYLTKFKITHRGFVTLQIAAGQWTYPVMTQFDHPSNGHIGIVGAAMLQPMPPPSSFAQNSSQAAQRYADTQSNLAMLRACFATELHYTQGAALTVMGTFGFLDGLLVSGDGSTGPVSDAQLISCCGAYDSSIYWTGTFTPPPQGTSSGLAAVQGGWGFTAIGGAETTNFWSGGPLVACGNHWSGFIGNSRSAIWMNSGAYAFGNGQEGFDNLSTSAMSVSGGNGLAASCNAGHGILSASGSGFQTNAGYSWKNGAWGAYAQQSSFINCSLDFGVGGANANASGSLMANVDATMIITGSAHYSPTSPPYGTTGNTNSVVVG